MDPGKEAIPEAGPSTEASARKTSMPRANASASKALVWATPGENNAANEPRSSGTK